MHEGGFPEDQRAHYPGVIRLQVEHVKPVTLFSHWQTCVCACVYMCVTVCVCVCVSVCEGRGGVVRERSAVVRLLVWLGGRGLERDLSMGKCQGIMCDHRGCHGKVTLL